jgi:hypothetical protein
MAKPESDHEALSNIRWYHLLLILPILAFWWCLWEATDWLQAQQRPVLLTRIILALILIGLLWTQYH